MLKIAIIIGSTRPRRNGEAVAKWAYQIAQKRNDAEVELVDIKELQSALVRRTSSGGHVQLSLMTDFENFTVFKPAEHHEKSVNTMLDQLVAWAGALKTLRGKTS